MGTMILGEMLNIGVADSVIAGACPRNSDEIFRVILESSLDVASFTYEKSRNDPKPKVMVLGRWQHPTSGNSLVCGINLHYLSKEQINALKQIMPQVMTKDSLKAKYWEGMTLAPDIFKTAYRTYDERFIRNVNNSEFDIPDHIPEPQQQDIEPLNKPTSPEEPIREPSSVPPPDIGDEPSEPIGDVGLGDVGTTPNVPAPGVDDRIPQQPEEPKPSISAPVATPETLEATPATATTPEPKQAEKAEETPEELPTKTKGILSKAKDLIGKLSSMISGKLGRNKKPAAKSASKSDEKMSSKEMASHIDNNLYHKTEDEKREVEKLRQIEDEHELLDNTNDAAEKQKHEHGSQVADIADSVKSAEAKIHPNQGLNVRAENFEQVLDAILEDYQSKPRGQWQTKDQYIELHAPEKFFSYNSQIGDVVLESATGTSFFVVYHKPTNKMVLDLADSVFAVLEDAGWKFSDTICLTADQNQVTVLSEARDEKTKQILNSNIGRLLVEVSRQ